MEIFWVTKLIEIIFWRENRQGYLVMKKRRKKLPLITQKSIASGLTLLEAKADKNPISLASISLEMTHGSLICNLFCVKVPKTLNLDTFQIS